MQYIKKHIFVLTALTILIGLYFLTRLYSLTSLPIFTDEAIYIRWAQIAQNDATWRFISLTDGKQPSFIWIAMVFLEFIKDPLLAGRLVSVMAGFFSLIGIFLLGREIFKNTKVGILSALLYVLYPFSLLYDKLALYDSLVAMFIIWSLYFSVLLARHVRLDLALILGLIIGGGMLTKTSANFGFILLPFSLLLFPFKGRLEKIKLIKWGLFSLAAFVIAQGMYTVLRLSPFYHIIGEKNLTFIYSFSEWFQNPFAYLNGNLEGLVGWLVGYMSIPFLVLAFSSFFVSKKYTKEKLLLLVWFIVPFIALAFFGKVIYPRFILFMTMPLLVLGAYSLYCLITYTKQSWLKVLVFFVFTSMWFYTDFYLLTNYMKAPIPQSDRVQLISDWPAGGGVRETVAFLEEKAKDEKIFVGTQGTFGLMPYALEIYLGTNPNVTIKGYWPIKDNPPQEVLDAAKEMPTYLVFYQPCPPCEGIGKAPISWPLIEEFQIKKDNDAYYTVYRLKSE